jgi:glucose-6-phosphate isomerase
MCSSHPQKGLSLVSLAVSLPKDLAKAVAAQRKSWDASPWSWRTIVEEQLADVSRFKPLGAEIAEDGFARLVLLGVGGSSLCSQVFGTAFGKQPNAPQLLVFDSTDPAQIRALCAKVDPARTLFCVSSKSGTTLEKNLHLQYFLKRRAKRWVTNGRAITSWR